MTQTPADRSRNYRRRNGIQPRTLSNDPVARAKRQLRRGATMADLDPNDADAYRAYHRELAANRRRKDTP